jgi:class 3 adenylate cyclase/YHS domain-containing protein
MEATFCFVDLAGFTALTEAHGDDAAADLVARFAATVDAALQGDATVVDRIGDAVFLVGETPERLLRCLQRLWSSSLEEAEFPILHAGVHHGEAVLRDGRWVGTAVNLAARVAAHARGGQVLATAPVAARAAVAGIDARSIGRTSLRNLLAPVELFVLDFPAGCADDVVDPVCRMRVCPESAPGHVRHDERDYWFCSLACVARFAANPSAYASA